jgi:hypothetical protein
VRERNDKMKKILSLFCFCFPVENNANREELPENAQEFLEKVSNSL